MDRFGNTFKTVVKPIALILLFFPFQSISIAAASDSDDEIQELRKIIEQQQSIIDQLLSTQERQAQELAELRTTVNSGDSVVGAGVNDVVDEPYESIETPQNEPEVVDTPLHVLPTGARFSMGGHINRAINIADDGARTDTYHVDSGSVPTLAYLKAYLPVNEGLTVGGHIEYALQHNSASLVSQDQQNPGFTTSARNFEVTIDSKRYGKLWMGRGLMSSFIAVEIDKTQTWRYNIISPGNVSGGLKFVKESDGSLSDLTVASVFIDAEAFNRKDRIRYDSPVFGGFKLSGDFATADSSDVALRWNGKLAGLDVSAAVAAQNNPIEGRVEDRIEGGLGVFHNASGVSFTAAMVDQDYTRAFYEQFGRDEGGNRGYAMRLGWRRNWFELGETRMALDYSDSEDVLYSRDRARSTGFFISQNIDNWSVEPYFGYRYFDYDAGPDANGLTLEDMHVWSLGLRMALDLSVQ